jgi:hypothetical protein
MSSLNQVVNMLGLAWIALWAAAFLLQLQLRRLLSDVDPGQLETLQVEQGTLDPREPFRAYVRFRRFVRDQALRRAYPGRPAAIVERLAWILTCLEIPSAILIPLTLFAGLRGSLGLSG